MKRIGTKISYYGMDLWITMPYVAVDKCGAIHEYQHRPNTPKFYASWIVVDNANIFLSFGMVDLEGEDWTATLKQYNLITGEEILNG